MENKTILEERITAVKEAGKEIQKIYKEGFSISYKEDDSPVTNADLASNQIIRTHLSKFKDIAWLSEESQDDLSRLEKREVFIVDPLDGTEDFVRKDGSFAVNVAYAVDGKPVLAVIGVPRKNSYAYAIKGEGSYYVDENGKKTKLTVSSRKENLIRLISKTHRLNSEAQIKEKYSSKITEVLAIGASLKGIALAGGRGDISIRYTKHTKEWDVCSRDLIVKEAGGIFLDGIGNEFTYNRKDVYNQNGYSMFNCKENKELRLK